MKTMFLAVSQAPKKKAARSKATPLSYLWRTHLKTPSGHLIPQIVPDPLYTMFFSYICAYFVVSLGHIQIARTTTLGFEATIRQHKGDLNTSHQDIPSESGDGAK